MGQKNVTMGKIRLKRNCTHKRKNQKPYLTYVFALEDTITTKISKTPYLWKMEQQHYDSVLAMLEQYEGNTKQKDIAKGSWK